MQGKKNTLMGSWAHTISSKSSYFLFLLFLLFLVFAQSVFLNSLYAKLGNGTLKTGNWFSTNHKKKVGFRSLGFDFDCAKETKQVGVCLLARCKLKRWGNTITVSGRMLSQDTFNQL